MSRKPCNECPFGRKTPPGMTGGADTTVFIGQAHGPFFLPCHMDPGYKKDKRSTSLLQCAGAAIFRANIGVDDLMPDGLLHLPADREASFSSPAELFAHHEQITVRAAEVILPSPVELLRQELRAQGAQRVSPPPPPQERDHGKGVT